MIYRQGLDQQGARARFYFVFAVFREEKPSQKNHSKKKTRHKKQKPGTKTGPGRRF
jgi:hypothetical protein